MKRDSNGRFINGPDKIILDLEAVKNKYTKGDSCAVIAEFFKVSPQTIHRRLIEMKIERRVGEFKKGHKPLEGIEKGWFKGNSNIKKIYNHKNVNGRKIKVHRQVMEKHLNRKLRKEEVVHHINGNPKDNRIENLQLFNNQSEHMTHHIKNF